jgi:hypothetical protein
MKTIDRSWFRARATEHAHDEGSGEQPHQGARSSQARLRGRKRLGDASPKRALWSNASEARNASNRSQIQSSKSKLGHFEL